LLDALARGARSVDLFDHALPDRVRHALASTPPDSRRALEPALHLLLSVASIGDRIVHGRTR
jgi:hypothetical protein